MPKSSKKSGVRKSRQGDAAGTQVDFTLADFADSTSSSSRLKKGAANALSMSVKDIAKVPAGNSESLAWYEKDLSEFDIEVDESQTGNQFDDENDENIEPEKCSKDAGACAVPGEDRPGQVYPLDIWFGVAGYVDPEDVGRFAAICSGAHTVVHTAQFWMNLYKKHWSSSKKLPWMLMPSYMHKIHGLRTRVIRSLYHMYPVFEEKLHSQGPFEEIPHYLLGAACTSVWYNKSPNSSTCQFFFKFYKPYSNPCPLAKPAVSKKDRFSRFLPNLYHNPEDGHLVIHVTSDDYVPLPMVMGMYLHKTLLTVGQGMKHMKLRLMFTSIPSRSNKASQGSETVVLIDPSLSVRVYKWWHPRYPHPTTAS